MEGIATDLASLGGREQESVIEVCIVADQNSSVAPLLANRFPDVPEDVCETVALAYGAAQWIRRINAVEFERRRFDVRALEGVDVYGHRVADGQALIRVESDKDSSELEERIRLSVEAAGLDIHDHGQESAETAGHGRRFLVRAVMVRF